jgi:rhomboid-like protein
MFDHVAHLAGALFGLAYYQVGPQFWTWLRVKLGAEERQLGL